MPSFLFLSEQQTQELITHLQVLSHCWWLAAVRRSADPLRDHPPSRHRPDSEADVGDDLGCCLKMMKMCLEGGGEMESHEGDERYSSILPPRLFVSLLQGVQQNRTSHQFNSQHLLSAAELQLHTSVSGRLLLIGLEFILYHNLHIFLSDNVNIVLLFRETSRLNPLHRTLEAADGLLLCCLKRIKFIKRTS